MKKINYTKYNSGDILPASKMNEIQECIIQGESDKESLQTQIEDLEKKIINNNEGYIFSDQFYTDDNNYVAIGNRTEDVEIDLEELFTNGIVSIKTPDDTTAKISWYGTRDTANITSRLFTQIFASMSGKIVSLPKGVEYTNSLDISKYDSIDIFSLHNGEYVDKDGNVYTYKNVNSLADGTTNAKWSAMGRGSDGKSLSTPTDNLTAICFRRDATCYDDYSSIITQWGESTNKAGEKYFQFRSTGYGFERKLSSWGILLDFKYPKTTSEVPFCYASFPDANGQIVTFDPISYDEFLTTTKINVCTMRYSSDSRGVLFYFKPDTSYGYNVSSGVLNIRTTKIENAWIVIKRADVAYEKTINNTLPVYAGGSIVFVPDENMSEHASIPTIKLNTKHYVIEEEAAFKEIKFGESISSCSGVINYSVVASKSTNLGDAIATNGIMSENRTDVFPSIIGTKISILCTDGQTIHTEELFSNGDLVEDQDENSYNKKFSDEIILNSDWVYAVNRIGTTNGCVYEFRIPLSALNSDEKPKEATSSEISSLLTSSFTVKSENTIRNQTTFSYNEYGMSYSYSNKNDYFTILIAQNYVTATIAETKKAVDNSNIKIKYPLSNVVKKYNVNKIFLKENDRLFYNQLPNYNGCSKINVRVPKNTNARLDQIKPIIEDINDLNYRVEHVVSVVSSSKIGVGDGKTDDTNAIQTAISSCVQDIGVVNEIVLEAGIYKISEPIIINKQNIIIRGNGEVIIEGVDNNYKYPLFVVQANDVKIDNIKFYLSYEDDDPQYTNGYNKNTDTDPGISTDIKEGLHCGIWLDAGNGYNYAKNNQAINEYLGFYRTEITNCTFIGGFRYSVKKIERSYGIYAPNKGFQNFSVMKNISCYNLYCGIRLGKCINSADVDFKFDYDVNHRGGTTSENYGGCRFGMITYSSYTRISCFGQLVGGDHMPPIYYDSDGKEHFMSDCTKVRKQLYDKTTKELVDVYTDDGWANGILTYRKVSEVGIAVFGQNNYIVSMVFDPQRSDNGCYYYGTSSKYNETFATSLIQNNLYGANETTYINEIYTRDVVVDGVTYEERVSYDVHQVIFTNIGLHNHFSEQSIENRDISFVGDFGVFGRDDDGSFVINNAKPFGMQDNFLSFVDKWGSVSVKQGDTVISSFATKNKNGTDIDVNNIGYIFDTNCNLYNGFATGITFKEVPTEDNPIIIDIDFGGNYTSISSGFIQFNQYIAKKMKICLIDASGAERYEQSLMNNHNAIVYYKPYNIVNNGRLIGSSCKGMRIKIYEGMKWTTADSNGVTNSNGKVGLSYIYMFNANNGGMSFVPRTGGKIYGNIEPEGIVLSSTDGTKKFKLSIDNSGTLSCVEVK